MNNDPDAEPDDIDHLGNRRLKAVGELLQGRLRIGLARLRRIIQDRMSTEDKDSLMPAQLVNFRPIAAVIKEFFASSQLSQFMDQVNPLAELEHKRRISALGPGGLTRERASFEVRDVHRSHYGRICPIQTPEGSNIGLINYLASYTRINDFGFLEAPYAKVVNGVVTKEIVWYDASEEEKYQDHARRQSARMRMASSSARRSRRASKASRERSRRTRWISSTSRRTSSSPLPRRSSRSLQHDDANRALMGSNMQRQAVVSVKPDAAYVSTGQEEKVALDSGYVIVAEENGEIIEVDGAISK